jgi:hypothetical protein
MDRRVVRELSLLLVTLPPPNFAPPSSPFNSILERVVRYWHSNAYSSLFSSLFFRLPLNKFLQIPQDSFDPVGFAIFAKTGQSMSGRLPPGDWSCCGRRSAVAGRRIAPERSQDRAWSRYLSAGMGELGGGQPPHWRQYVSRCRAAARSPSAKPR